MVEFFQDFYKNIVAFDLIYLIITLYSIIQCSNKGFVLSLLAAAKWLLAYVITLILFPRVKSYIGNVLRKRPVMLDKNRPRLVGIFPKDRTQSFNAGTIMCKPDGVSGFGEGWITGATYSPALGHWIGIGFISGGFENWVGKTGIVADPIRDKTIKVEIVSPHMFDSAGERLHA